MSIISEWQPRVTQEREGKVPLPTNAGKARPEGRAQGGEIRRAQVREFAAFDIAPHLFDRVQFGRVGRQPLHAEPRALLPQVRRHRAALVGAQPVPEQNHALRGEVPPEVPEEGDERHIGVAAGVGLEVEARAPAVPAERQGGGDREPLPVASRMGQDRGRAAGRPGPADDRLLRDPAFVLENEPRVPPRGVFFRAAQRRLFHCAMAASSRSPAWRAGRWSDHPKARSTRQTWPG